MNDYPIHSANPVNWLDSLNDGMTRWWLGTPDRWGTSRLWDLCDKGHGTLTNMTPPSDWNPTVRQGGQSDLSFAHASSKYVDVPYTPMPGSVTFEAWVKTTSSSSFPVIYNADNIGTSRRLQVRMTSAGKFEVVPFAPGAYVVTSTTSINDGDWHHVAFTHSPSDTRVYVDGKQETTSSSGTGNIATGSSAANEGIGKTISGSTRYWDGQIDGMTFWQRDMGPSGVAELYHDGLQGYPRRLNRMPVFAGAIPSGGGGGFQPAWAINSTLLAGCIR